MSVETMQDLLIDELKDLYSAEKQIVKALPKLAKAVSDESLKEALESHLQETKGQVTRLEQIGKILETRLEGKTCAGMKGVLEEGPEMIDEVEEGALLDATLEEEKAADKKLTTLSKSINATASQAAA